MADSNKELRMYYGYVNDTAGERDHFGGVCESETYEHAKEVVESTLTRIYGDAWEFNGQYRLKDAWHQWVLARIEEEPLSVIEERIAKQREEREAEEQQLTILNAAATQAVIATEGKIIPKADFRNQERWQSYVVKNPDPYGKATIDYTERWALLMEEKIDEGAKLEDIADSTSHEADTEGITGFMYGMAISIMVACDWVYAEQLRRWHNLSIQIGNEGEEANESGGVLNPAILHMGL